MRKLKFTAMLAFTVLFCLGCAEMEVPKTSDIIKDPLGSGTVKIGMTKDKVVSVYGEPDLKRTVVSDEWNAEREEWFYKARYSALPVNAGYLAKDLYLYFDGVSLTTISDKPLGKDKLTEIKEEKDAFIK
ncbi:MAG: hypothetical protein ABH862_06130 [Candidatus Omnitrophota bacterium]